MHLKRQKAPKEWPIHRKGTKYVVRPKFSYKEGVPILIFLRDMLKIAQNRKEVKKSLQNKQILLNDKPVKDEKNTILLFDKIEIVPSKKFFSLTLSKFGKFTAEEIKENEAHEKIAKIIDKTILKKKKIQLNLSDGKNYLSNEPCKVNDSAIINFKDKKIKKFIPLKENTKVFIFAGKHTGNVGKINKIVNERKMVELELENKKTNVLIKQIMAIE
jgi:small subunit ribosomal protein S4e